MEVKGDLEVEVVKVVMEVQVAMVVLEVLEYPVDQETRWNDDDIVSRSEYMFNVQSVP